MSLAATVYIKKSHISIEWLDETISVDEASGEIVSEKFHIPAKAKEAVAYRLGNDKYISHCRKEIEKVAKGRGLAMPILLEHVLSGEVEPGDVVTFADIPEVKARVEVSGASAEVFR